MRYIDSFRNPAAARKISDGIRKTAQDISRPVCIMEVCGSHTMAIARFAIRELLPENIRLVSGPGCPVCVTSAGYIDTAMELARRGCALVTFGDMVNVPGSSGTLAMARSEGADIRICYSPSAALEMAMDNHEKDFVFLGIGFETTVPTVLSVIDHAAEKGIANLSVLTAFKRVPPALDALASDPEIEVDAFLCPAHVSAIIGAFAYEPFVEKFKVPCVIAGFEPLDILYGIHGILTQINEGRAEVENQYSRVVRNTGNARALSLMDDYLEEYDASWRGIGVIPGSGFRLKDEYAKYDAEKKYGVRVEEGNPDRRCRCGEVLKGKMLPSECPLFEKLCTPSNPVGPCMVSSEGSCAAYFKYSR